jgi:hypothetical protein
MDDQTLWYQMNVAMVGLGNRYEPVVEKAAKEEAMDLRTWSTLLAVLTFEPEDSTPAHFMVRGPYTAPEAYLSHLVSASEAGFLSEVEGGKFRLTERGRRIVLDLVALGRGAMANADPLSVNDSHTLMELLNRMVGSCLETPAPPETWSIQLSFKLMPEPEPPMPNIEQAISALAAYRDDAHLAAWQNTELSATALETLTLLWNGEVNSLQAICKRLERRGHPCKVYKSALEDLRTHHLINGPDEAPWLTGVGRVFRNQIEEVTNRYFYKPWVCLNEAEKMEMGRILALLIDGLKG